MSILSGRIDCHTVFTCGECKNQINPYTDLSMIGVTPEEAFEQMPPCQCGVWQWQFNQ